MQSDEDDAQGALDFIAPDRRVTVNIGPAVDALEKEHGLAMNVRMSDFTKGNAKARLRMVAQYGVAGDERLLVVGTDHAAESVTGFYTKFGDGGADVMPMAGLNKRQVKMLVKELGGPNIYGTRYRRPTFLTIGLGVLMRTSLASATTILMTILRANLFRTLSRKGSRPTTLGHVTRGIHRQPFLMTGGSRDDCGRLTAPTSSLTLTRRIRYSG